MEIKLSQEDITKLLKDVNSNVALIARRMISATDLFVEVLGALNEGEQFTASSVFGRGSSQPHEILNHVLKERREYLAKMKRYQKQLEDEFNLLRR